MKSVQGLLGGVSQKVIIGIIAAAVFVGVALYSSNSSKPEVALKSVEECNKTISDLIENDKDHYDEVLKCKEKIMAECDSSLAEVDKALGIEADWNELTKLFEERKAITGACFDAWIDGPLAFIDGDKDMPLLGRGELGQATALSKLCDESLRKIDEKLKSEKDYKARRNLYNQRSNIVDYCFEEWLSGSYGQEGIPLLGKNDYGETDAFVANCLEQIKASSDPIDIINKCKKEFKDFGYDKSQEPDWDALASSGSPKVDSVNNKQLHGSYEETPHKYKLYAVVSNKGDGRLTYTWKINCGYFVGPTNGSEVEWHYDTPGECVDAVVTVAVANSAGGRSEKNHKVF